jgi:hypothetical protein
MEKETKILLGVVALGVVGYYLFNKSKKVVEEKPKEVTTTKDFQVPKECPKGFEWKKINCVNEPCPSGCMQIQEELTEEQKYYARNPIFVTQDEYVPVLDVPQLIISPYDAARMQALRGGGLRDGGFVV